MDFRTRSKQNEVYLGEVYTTSHGYHETLGVGTSVLENGDAEDYWHKKAREDSSLPPSPCWITSHFREPLCMNRNTLTFRFTNHPVSDQGTASVNDLDYVRHPRSSPARFAENDALTQVLLERTNPFRPEFSIPVALKELVDVGTLFKIAAKSFSSFVGGTYLNYKFGWVQFVRDLKTLHGITEALESRIKEFKSLSMQGGVRRKVQLGYKEVPYFLAAKTIQSSWGVTIKADVSGDRNCRIHGTVRWRFKPGVDIKLDRLQQFNAAVSKVFDLGQLDSQTVWNLIPFSWLVDYFIGLDTYFGANLGEGVIEPYDICIVRTAESKFTQKVVLKPSTITLTGSGHYGRKEYSRDVWTKGSYPIVAVWPLSTGQMATIAALAASFKR